MVAYAARLAGLMLASGLVLASSEAWATARTGPSTPEPSTAATGSAAGIEVEVDASITNADAVRGWVEERAARAVRELERRLDAEDVIRIVVQGGAYDYRISLLLLRHGSALAPDRQPEEIACACGSDQMLETVAAAITAGARTLGEVADREREEVARQQEEEELRQQETERQRRTADGTTRYRPSPVGRAGIGVLGAGGVLATSGIVMALQPPQLVNGLQVVVRDWSSPGYTVLGIGAAAMVGGLTVLLVDVVRCRRDRSRCRAPTMAWATETRHGGAR